MPAGGRTGAEGIGREAGTRSWLGTTGWEQKAQAGEPGQAHVSERKARSRRHRPESQDRSMRSMRERIRPDRQPVINRRRLKRVAERNRVSQGMAAAGKAIPTRTLSRERARLKSSASFALST